jgi:hypothetical protein
MNISAVAEKDLSIFSRPKVAPDRFGTTLNWLVVLSN